MNKKQKTCPYIFTKGKNKGDACGKKVFSDSKFCSTHSKYEEPKKIVKKKEVETEPFLQNTGDKQIVYLTSNNFKKYIENEFGIKDIFNCPSEAYLVTKRGKTTIRILDKFDEDKLMTAVMTKREYEIMLGDFKVFYAISLKNQPSIKNRKFEIRKQICKENNINIFYRENENYFNEVSSWNEMKHTVNINKYIINLYENKDKLKLTTTKSIQKAVFEKFMIKIPLKYIINLLG